MPSFNTVQTRPYSFKDKGDFPGWILKQIEDAEIYLKKLFQCLTLSVKYIQFVSTLNLPIFSSRGWVLSNLWFFRLFQLMSVL